MGKGSKKVVHKKDKKVASVGVKKISKRSKFKDAELKSKVNNTMSQLLSDDKSTAKFFGIQTKQQEERKPKQAKVSIDEDLLDQLKGM
ncbi:hypothetical protein TRVA0_069S00408 [Trichomonascus vanleenenianus]|uniref:uncharacterized protein n=1 Tax=Trichomonascus vanleenenianus TaxID=2268995 RepID=UPI003ECA5FBD